MHSDDKLGSLNWKPCFPLFTRNIDICILFAEINFLSYLLSYIVTYCTLCRKYNSLLAVPLYASIRAFVRNIFVHLFSIIKVEMKTLSFFNFNAINKTHENILSMGFIATCITKPVRNVQCATKKCSDVLWDKSKQQLWIIASNLNLIPVHIENQTQKWVIIKFLQGSKSTSWARSICIT